MISAATETIAAPLPSRSVRRTLIRLLAGFVVFVVAGNLAIVGASLWARKSHAESFGVQGVGNFQRLDDHVWRGKAPTADGYRNLAANGVSTIVDLRAESDITDRQALFDELGIDGVRMPIRDGQSPTQGQVEEFLEVVRQADGVVF